MAELTPKQERFCREYLIDLNATQAAIRAGYAEGSAKVTASRLLSNANVAARIAELQEKTARKVEITAEAIANELALLAFANMEDYAKVGGDLSKLTREQLAAIQEAVFEELEDGKVVRRTKIKLAGKRESLETLGRYLGLEVERRLNINVDLKDVDDDELDARIRAIEAQLAGSEAGAAAPARGAASPTRH